MERFKEKRFADKTEKRNPFLLDCICFIVRNNFQSEHQNENLKMIFGYLMLKYIYREIISKRI